ncbi:hypothetical protein [Rummeliibacillus pycnus]|uniref:hypothetical protein n=1 Tax=Rummeliibacillus pycnus TaxID=101070 RepID=UPI002481BCB2|nr:hypothetical protein [Rummeliibacillus pycnus]
MGTNRGVSSDCGSDPNLPSSRHSFRALYGAAELGSAVSGKDWVSGRDLGTGERWFRGVLAPLDIVPGVSGLAKFSSTARLARVGETASQLGLKTGVSAGFRQGVNHIDNMIKTAGQYSVSRLKSAYAAIKDAAHVVKNKLATDIIETGKLADTIITGVKNTIPSPERLVVTSTGEKMKMLVENSHGVENSIRDLIRKIDGINIEGSRGTGELNKDLAKAYLRDIEAKTGRKVNKEQIHLIKEALRTKNYEKLTPKETAKHRSKFTSSLKDKLIAEWEEKTKQKWPRYTEEVLDKNGEVARSIGQPYDAHHIIENNFGGPHEWWNIHPAKYPNEHQAGIHGKGAPSGKLFPRR